MPAMPPTRTRAAAVFAVWTLVVWATRIRNVASDDAASASERLVSVALSLSFTALALAVLVVMWRAPRHLAAVVRWLAVWTVGVWIVRLAGIATAGHDAAFVVVHAVLAVVSVGLAIAADRAVRRSVGSEAVGGRDLVQG